MARIVQNGKLTYIYYQDRASLLAILEFRIGVYFMAKYAIPERAATFSMQKVILWTNGMVMVFDDEGEQMPAYQGMFETVVRLINNVYAGAWLYGDWRSGILSQAPFPDTMYTHSEGRESLRAEEESTEHNEDE